MRMVFKTQQTQGIKQEDMNFFACIFYSPLGRHRKQCEGYELMGGKK